MATIIEHRINNIKSVPYKDFNPVIVAEYGDDGLAVQPSLEIENVVFQNVEGSLNSSKVRSLFEANPVEGALYSMFVQNENTVLNFDFFMDYAKMEYLDDVSTSVDLIKDKSVNSLIDYNGADVTMQLLYSKGLINSTNIVYIPFVAKNRKTALEKIFLSTQIFLTVKSLYDEMFKLFAILSDLPTLGAPIAITNLAATITALTLIIIRLVNLIRDSIDLIFPPVKYHSAVKLITYLEKALEYLGYDVDFGYSWTELEGIILMPRKVEDEGLKNPSGGIQEAILKPSDFGYTLDQLFVLCKRKANTKIAIIGNTVHIRPVKDSFWYSNSGFVMDSTKIESSIFVDNGRSSFNYEDLVANRVIEYQTDDSDYWTNHDRANNVNNVTSVAIKVQPVVTGDKKRNLLKGFEVTPIPYALGVRNDLIENVEEFLPPIFAKFRELLNSLKTMFDSNSSDLGNVDVPEYTFITHKRHGALKIENEFFSSAKLIYATFNTSTGVYEIPSNYHYKVGARATYENYYAFDSLVEGVRSPQNPPNTNGKQKYKDVKIKMTLDDFNLLVENSYFSGEFGGGKFTRIAWNVKKDSAICDFWIQKNWLKNVKETII